MESYIDLNVWDQSVKLIEEIYLLTQKFPKTEIFALTQQIQRSSVSIALNIAEGYGRYTFPDKSNKYTIARGECTETEAAIRIAIRLKFISDEESKQALYLCDRIGKMLSGLIRSCQERSKRP